MERMALPNVNAAEVELPYYLDKTWVQCESTACMKWRLISRRECEGLDPNQPWYCHMNQDPLFSHCLAPEGPFPKASQLQKCGLQFMYSRIPVGSLVMVKASNWPRWPAVLSTDPDSAGYVQEDYAGNVVKYHVEFLGSPRSRLWVSAKAIQLYRAAAPEPKNLKDSLQQSFKVALEEAAKMEHITREERLQQCLFKPQDLLYQAVSLMHEIEKMIEGCYSVQTSTSSIHKGKMSSLPVRDSKWTDEDRVVEVGDLLIIEGIIFQSGRSPEEIKKEVPRHRQSL